MNEPKILGEVYLSGDEAKRILKGLAWRRCKLNRTPSGTRVYVWDDDMKEAEEEYVVSVKRFEDEKGNQGFAYSLRPKG